MGRIGAAVEPLKKAAALADAAPMLDHRRQPAFDLLVKAGNLAGARVAIGPQIDPGLQHRKVGPDVRPAKRQYLAKFHRWAVFVDACCGGDCSAGALVAASCCWGGDASVRAVERESGKRARRSKA